MTAKPPWSALKVAVVTWITMVVLLMGVGITIVVLTDDGQTVDLRTAKITQGALTFSTICCVLAYFRRKRKLDAVRVSPSRGP
ncbi:MAG: hypothetical protein H0T46_35275 [Deltaproteobacteria bacterium]|nr:hypothetical protein [Deltaproteobacteria bacterium]